MSGAKLVLLLSYATTQDQPRTRVALYAGIFLLLSLYILYVQPYRVRAFNYAAAMAPL